MNGKKAKAVRLYTMDRAHYRRMKKLAKKGLLFSMPVRDILYTHHMTNNGRPL